MSYFGTSRLPSRLPQSQHEEKLYLTGTNILAGSGSEARYVRLSGANIIAIQGQERSIANAKIVSTDIITKGGTRQRVLDYIPADSGTFIESSGGSQQYRLINQETGSVISSISHAGYMYYWVCEHEEVEPEDIIEDLNEVK